MPLVVATAALLLTSYVGEGLSRRAFWANHQLEIERNDERRAHEQAESNLKVLGQAIGGIVHDLGNPLTSVPMGASTLDLFLDSGETDEATLKEFTAIIGRGAQMLNFLRLSLIEQTRILEGQPIPVELKLTSVAKVVKMGADFQKPAAQNGRVVAIECPDVAVCADEMKMVTVWMNLIGNALKYSDGSVRVEWRSIRDASRDAILAMAVLDAGTRGVGIAQTQAAKLFRAFGRLETHAKIEGTGLGLLSVQKIVEAHGGEVYIEGFANGIGCASPSICAPHTACAATPTSRAWKAAKARLHSRRPATPPIVLFSKKPVPTNLRWIRAAPSRGSTICIAARTPEQRGCVPLTRQAFF